MSFVSWNYLLFFPCVVLLFFTIPTRFKVILLLISSYIFYMGWKWEYIFLLLFVTIVNYVFASFINRYRSVALKKVFLSLALFFSLSVLFFFKYFNFAIDVFSSAFSKNYLPSFITDYSVILPVGISFFTFQALSYVIDVYRKNAVPAKSFHVFAVYVSFFPQLVAGPIERSTSLLPQFYNSSIFSRDRLFSGVQIILWGFFKKIVIADRLAVYVNAVYSDVHASSPLNLIFATYFFAFQILCDFSGYSDIAIGSARILGYDLMENFNNPYFSSSLRDFWRRWHISLSTWFRDYLYIPLGGNRKGVFKTYLNLLITMILCGLWHGASWSFVIWGTFHGLLLALNRAFSGIFEFKLNSPYLSNLLNFLKILITFNLVCLLWIFFRASSISDAIYAINKIFDFLINCIFSNRAIYEFTTTNIFEFYSLNDLLIISVFTAIFLFFERWFKDFVFNNRHLLFCLFFSSVIFWIIVVWGAFNDQEFIYFQF